MQRRYSHLHLKWNPFGEATPEDRAVLAQVDLAPFLPLLSPLCALELRGAHGRGKSTTLMALRRSLAPTAPYVRGSRHHQEIPVAPWVFLDEVQCFHIFRLWSFARRMKKSCGTIVYSTHQNRQWLFRLAGFVTRQTVVDYSKPETLMAVFNQRIAWAQNHRGPPPQLCCSDIENLKVQFGDDIRGMENHLYDRINQLADPATPMTSRTNP